jgi:DNA-binding NarL/FixJ family response regulator
MNNTEELKVFVLSNQNLYLDALISLLNTDHYHLNASGTIITTNTEAFKFIEEEKPHVVLLDANGMGKTIWELLLEIKKRFVGISVIMLANTNEPIYLSYANKNGANGYVLKSSPKELLIAAIKIVTQGGKFYDPGVNNDQGEGGLGQKLSTKYNLSDREIEVVTLIKDGYTSKEICKQLNLSCHTIETHRKNVYRKLHINKVTELLKIFNSINE